MTCRATADDHCCWLRGEVCPHFDPTLTDGFCSLRAELGSWEAVHADGRFTADVAPKLALMVAVPDCGSWPTPGTTCGTCGAVG